MDPSPTTSTAAATRLPRPRGDGPRSAPPPGRSAAAPPPTRGWTAGAPRVRRQDVGSPAHAGMDLSELAEKDAGMLDLVIGMLFNFDP